MGYSIVYRRAAKRFLDGADEKTRKRVMAQIQSLPDAHDVKPLKGGSFLRLRIGQMRVIFMVDHDARLVSVLNIGARGNIYKRK